MVEKTDMIIHLCVKLGCGDRGATHQVTKIETHTIGRCQVWHWKPNGVIRRSTPAFERSNTKANISEGPQGLDARLSSKKNKGWELWRRTLCCGRGRVQPWQCANEIYCLVVAKCGDIQPPQLMPVRDICFLTMRISSILTSVFCWREFLNPTDYSSS